MHCVAFVFFLQCGWHLYQCLHFRTPYEKSGLSVSAFLLLTTSANIAPGREQCQGSVGPDSLIFRALVGRPLRDEYAVASLGCRSSRMREAVTVSRRQDTACFVRSFPATLCRKHFVLRSGAIRHSLHSGTLGSISPRCHRKVLVVRARPDLAPSGASGPVLSHAKKLEVKVDGRGRWTLAGYHAQIAGWKLRST